jgi:hypothetical protein
MQRVSPAARRVILWLIAVIPVSLALAGGVYSAVALPGCAACHDEAAFVSGTRDSAHAAVDCSDCHVGKALGDRVAFGFREAYHMVLPIVGGQDRDWAQVPDSRCLACHEAIETDVTSANGLRIAHVYCAASSQCSDCHSTTAHGSATSWVRVYDMETCLACHVSESSTQCDLCHEGRLPSSRVTSGVFAITHGPEWQQTHGMGNASTCTVCHTAATCEKCHGAGLPHARGFVREHAGFAASDAARCDTCHESRFCDDCHGLEMPHPKAFTRSHANAAAQDEALCLRCHADPDCTLCHETHVHPGGAIGTLGSGSGQ